MTKKLIWVGVIACLAIAVTAVIALDPAAAHMLAGHDLHTYAAEAAGGVAALEKQMGELATQLKGAVDEVKKSGEAATTEMKNLGRVTDETKQKADQALSKHNELAEQHQELVKKHTEAVGRLVEVEQALAARRENPDAAIPKSMGQKFVESDAFKSFAAKGSKGNVRVQMNRADIMNVTGTVGSNTSQANSLVPALRVPGIVMPPERKLTIRDLLAPGQTAAGMVEYVEETGFTNNARVVSEGATKPKSDLHFELKNAPVRTIAHIFKASRQILDDAPALQSYIDARGRYGLRLEEEDELLNGDGTGVHIKGLIPNATAYDPAFVPAASTRIDVIRLAILQVFLAEFPASGIVLNPVDWAGIQLTKDSQNRYIIGNPQDGNTPRLWNLPVVETQSVDPADFLVGAFNMGAQIFDRMEVEVLLSTENADDFEKNMVTIRAEERLAMAVYRPEAFVTGAFPTTT